MKPLNEYGPIDALGTAKFFAQADKFEEAKKALDLVKPYCVHPAQMDAIGKLYSDIREYQDCLELAMRMLPMFSDSESLFNVTSNIIRAHLNLNHPHDALDFIDINLKRKPNDDPTLLDKAMALFLLNRKKEAEALLRDVLPRTTDQDVANRIRFNLGTYDLANGDFQRGLRGFLLEGRKLDIWKKYDFPKDRQWEGGIQPGKTIMLSAEGGIGDEIINVRFAKHLKEAGMNPYGIIEDHFELRLDQNQSNKSVHKDLSHNRLPMQAEDDNYIY
jgi:tetratricopeptide (TPR) repeat protein